MQNYMYLLIECTSKSLFKNVLVVSLP